MLHDKRNIPNLIVTLEHCKLETLSIYFKDGATLQLKDDTTLQTQKWQHIANY